MKTLSTILSILLGTFIFAQTCTIDYSQTAPGVYPATLASGMAGEAYEGEFTILFPTEQAGVDYASFKITGIELPMGLTWECSNEATDCEYNPQIDPYACIRIYGTPAVSGSFEAKVRAKATRTDNATGIHTEIVNLEIAPSIGVADGFTYETAYGCETATVDFQVTDVSNYTPVPDLTTGIKYNWEFGNGYSSISPTPPTQTYTGAGEYEVELTQIVDTIGFRLKNVIITAVGCNDAVGYGNPDIYIHVIDGDGNVVYSTENNPNDANLSQTYTMNVLLNNPPYKIRVMDDDSDNLWGTADDNCINGDENNATTSISLPNVNNFEPFVQFAVNQSLEFNYLIEKEITETTSTAIVKVYNNPATPIVEVEGTLNEVVSLSTEDLGYVYHWTYEDDIMHNEKGTVIYPTETGDYAVIAVDENGCYSVSSPAAVNGILSIADELTMNFTIYPNPSIGVVNIDFENTMDKAQVLVMDLTGRIVSTTSIENQQSVSFDVSQLSSGVYTILIEANNAVVASEKLIVK